MSKQQEEEQRKIDLYSRLSTLEAEVEQLREDSKQYITKAEQSWPNKVVYGILWTVLIGTLGFILKALGVVGFIK